MYFNYLREQLNTKKTNKGNAAADAAGSFPIDTLYGKPGLILTLSG